MILAIASLFVLSIVTYTVYSVSPTGSNQKRLAKWISIYSFCGAVLFVFLVMTSPVAAQDNPAIPDGPLYVCRTDRVDLLELQFHNIPISWRVPTDDEPGMWYLGDAGYFDSPDGDPAKSDTLIVQALTDYMPGQVDEINFIRNGMAIAGTNDYQIALVGTIDTPLCGQGKWTVTMSGMNFSQLPDQNVDPSPAAVSSQGCPDGQHFAVNHSTGAYLTTSSGSPYCTSSSTEVVGIPPA